MTTFPSGVNTRFNEDLPPDDDVIGVNTRFRILNIVFEILDLNFLVAKLTIFRIFSPLFGLLKTRQRAFVDMNFVFKG